MIKENIRDYFVNAMRFYAQLGKPSLEELNGILITNLGIPLPFENSVYYTGFNELNKNLLAEYEDMKAVIRVLNRLKAEVGVFAVRIIESVYMVDANKKLCAMDITNRVSKVAIELFMDDSSVNRRIKLARQMFAEERGLRNTTGLLSLSKKEA